MLLVTDISNIDLDVSNSIKSVAKGGNLKVLLKINCTS